MTLDPEEFDSARGIGRRAVLVGGLGSAAFTVYPSLLLARSLDNPPVFESERHQYTMVEPARSMVPTQLTDLDGKQTTLRPAPGRVTLISFWATWCYNCRTDLPELSRLQQSMGHRIDVAAVSVDTEARADVKSFVEDLGIKGLAIYLDPNGVLAEPDASGSSRFPLFGMPITYLIAPNGRIAGYLSGSADWLSVPGQSLLAYYQAA